MSNMRQQRTQKRPLQKYRKRQQYGGFLKRYDSAYTGRDTVNQLGKVAPGIIKTTSTEINDIAQQRINQILSPGEKEIDRVLPNILRGAMDDVYQTPFRLLQKFGRQ